MIDPRSQLEQLADAVAYEHRLHRPKRRKSERRRPNIALLLAAVEKAARRKPKGKT